MYFFSTFSRLSLSLLGALAEDNVLCTWAKHFTLTVSLSTQVYKWVPLNLMLGGNPTMD